MKVLFFLAFAVLASNAASVLNLDSEEWQAFKLKFNKIYPSEAEEKFRMKIFLESKEKVTKHNERHEKGEVTYKMGINQLSDLLPEEIDKMYKGFKRTGKGLKTRIRGSTFVPPVNVELPDEINWVEKGAVTPVKNQKQCGSCWAFSTTGALEGQHFLKTGNLVSLSEQNLVDCSRKLNQGCNGGIMDFAFTYIKENNGIDTEESYPYEGVDDICRFNASNVGATDTGFVDLTSGDENALKTAVATVGPISVAIDVESSFMNYESGVLVANDCTNHLRSLNHGVLVVGYGTDAESKLDYWLVKNSWSAMWGDHGYIKMARNRNNMCGIATEASYPLV